MVRPQPAPAAAPWSGVEMRDTDEEQGESRRTDRSKDDSQRNQDNGEVRPIFTHVSRHDGRSLLQEVGLS